MFTSILFVYLGTFYFIFSFFYGLFEYIGSLTLKLAIIIDPDCYYYILLLLRGLIGLSGLSISSFIAGDLVIV